MRAYRQRRATKRTTSSSSSGMHRVRAETVCGAQPLTPCRDRLMRENFRSVSEIRSFPRPRVPPRSLVIEGCTDPLMRKVFSLAVALRKSSFDEFQCCLSELFSDIPVFLTLFPVDHLKFRGARKLQAMSLTTDGSDSSARRVQSCFVVPRKHAVGNRRQRRPNF